jgi:hypothetical protein
MYERLPVAFYFGPGCLAGRNDPDRVAATLNIDDHGHDQLHPSACNLAFLSKIFPAVRRSQNGMLENLDCVGEIYAVLADVASILRFVPFELHATTYMYLRLYIQCARVGINFAAPTRLLLPAAIDEMLQFPVQKQKRPIRENRPFILSNPECQRLNLTS